MEEWLNGWARNDDMVLMETSTYCAGCGRLLGIFCADIERCSFPEKSPDFPFSQDDCPLCKRWHRHVNITVGDLIKLDISMLRKAIAIKKSVIKGEEK
jgi:hypothetical protein